MKARFAIVFILICGFSNAADKNLDGPKQAAKANNKFGLELYHRTDIKTDKGNKFLSPLSVSMALAMAYNGATEKTLEEMEKTLALTGLSRDEVNLANASLLNLLNEIGGKQFELSVANALIAHKKAVLNEAFVTRVEKPYQAKLSVLDFLKPQALVEVNKWASDKTYGKIPTILDELNDNMRLLLLNAVYFKALWSQQFKETYLQPFTNGEGKRVEVPTMNHEGEWRYTEKDGAQVLELPYGDPQTGEEGPTSMVVVLPKEGTRLADYEKQMTSDRWEELTSALDSAEPQKVGLSLPNLQFSFDAKLNEPLKAAGMPLAFDAGKARFRDMTEEQVFLTLVRQKTFLGVNEEGTEAAAVTVAVAGTESIHVPPPVEMRVNRPYWFAIRERATNTLLFVGSINEPEGGKVPKTED